MQKSQGFDKIMLLVRRYIIFVLSLTLLGGIIAGAVTFYLLAPKYSSRTQVLIALPEKTESSVQIEDVNVNLQMVDTYKSLILGDLVLSKTLENLQSETKTKVTTKELLESLSITQDENSMLLNIKATYTDPKIAEQIARIITRVFQETVREMINSNEIILTSEAKQNNIPFFPNNALNILIGLILGFMISIGMVVIHYKWKENEINKSMNTLRYNYRILKMLD
ncbi:Wzz/FepE/Etk N-terminal domain-containing protein [uncultured Vagococcus sp.]|uniref:YveK family protein n=1 Tax=uncultured Vagococcus sp. TaxID=189676 RepID=UPI0028D0B9DB|nr:Wzz/FepE/Etk N-terminal domain-containing protein [uncultured Vagococcus sp.]